MPIKQNRSTDYKVKPSDVMPIIKHLYFCYQTKYRFGQTIVIQIKYIKY